MSEQNDSDAAFRDNIRNLVAERDLLREKCRLLEFLDGNRSVDYVSIKERQIIRERLAAIDARLKGE